VRRRAPRVAAIAAAALAVDVDEVAGPNATLRLHLQLFDLHLHVTAAVAQLVVAPDCGSGCRGFKSLQPPQNTVRINEPISLFW
jgi:hypothetical protein